MPDFNEAFGFTENEVIGILKELQISQDILEALKENYNGFCFSRSSRISERVYNPIMVFYYLRHYDKAFNPKSQLLIDSNVCSDYNKINTIFDFYKEYEMRDNVFHALINNTKIALTSIAEDYILTIVEYKYEQFVSMLYYYGYLTIENVDQDFI